MRILTDSDRSGIALASGCEQAEAFAASFVAAGAAPLRTAIIDDFHEYLRCVRPSLRPSVLACWHRGIGAL